MSTDYLEAGLTDEEIVKRYLNKPVSLRLNGAMESRVDAIFSATADRILTCECEWINRTDDIKQHEKKQCVSTLRVDAPVTFKDMILAEHTIVNTTKKRIQQVNGVMVGECRLKQHSVYGQQ